jgi:hypothetical protein
MCLQLGFEIFWQKDFGVKAAHKMLVKLTPGCIDVPVLTANIYAVATNRIDIHNKTGGMCHSSVYLLRCLWFCLDSKFKRKDKKGNIGERNVYKEVGYLFLK